MTTALAFCANTRVSLIDLPGTEHIDIPQASLTVHSLAEGMADKLQHPAKACPNPQLTWGPPQ